MPPPASTANSTGANVAGRPFSARGVRPNSPTQITSVSSSRPRRGQIVEQRGRRLVAGGISRFFSAREVVPVRVQKPWPVVRQLTVTAGCPPRPAAGRAKQLAVGMPAVLRANRRRLARQIERRSHGR